MFLTANKVLEAISYGEINITPFNEEMLHDSGELTLTLATHYREVRSVGLVDPENLPDGLFIDRPMPPKEGLIIHPGQFVNLKTREHIKLRRFGCLLATRPKLAQLGLDVTQGSNFVRCGSDCHLTLETTNNGPNMIRVYPGLPVVKAIFYLIR